MGGPDGQPRQAPPRGQEAAEEEQGQEGPGRRGRHAADDGHPPQLRLFVSVRPSEQAAAHLAAALGRPADPRWHLTLAFLGEQPAAERFDLSEVVRRHAPFPLALSQSMRLGRVVAAGVRGDLVALDRLAHDVQRACREAGAVLERRRFRPHLTLPRGVEASALWDYEGPAFAVDEVQLVHSVLGRSASHEVVRAFPLG